MGTSTLLLDNSTWDLVLDASGNIAAASTPYSLAQDAASACRTFLGEVYYDTTLGVPFLTEVFGHNPPIELLKSLFVDQAEAVPGVNSARCFIAGIHARAVTGQVQVFPDADAPAAFLNFSVINPQGV